MNVVVFESLQLLLLLIFGALISDFRRRPASDSLLPRGLVLALKIDYLIPFAIYGTVLFRLRDLYVGDYVALVLCVLGIALVIKARRDIGHSYTWAGYCLREPKLVRTGVYAYLRHPIYTGIVLFVVGGCLTVVPRISLPVFFLGLISLLFAFSVMYSAAVRETAYLSRTLGDTFDRYVAEVSAIVPFKRLLSVISARRNKSDS